MISVLALFQDDVPAQAGSDFGNNTMIHPVGVAALGLMAVLVLLVPRRWTCLPVILMLCFIPAGQRLVVASIDFTFMRVLMCVAWTRLFLRGDLKPIVWNHLDRVMVVWAFVCVVAGTLLGMTVPVFINRLGAAVDAMMLYFFFRQLVRDYRDLIQIATVFMASGFVVLVFFVIENQTSRNMFSVMGGVPLMTEERGGRMRCQGAFAHSILAGCFWACLIPFYFARTLKGSWVFAITATIVACVIVRLSASSTPIMAILFGVFAASLYPIRGALRWLRWLAFGWLLILHFYLMDMPVWHLLSRVDLVGGSTGWHRYHLVDKFFAFFREWWLFGTERTGHWGPGLHDVTNQFVAEGISGGIWRVSLFCLAIWLAFVGVSRSLRLPQGSTKYKLASWALGTALFMHCMNFLGVSYFEQMTTEWYMTLALTSSLTLVPGARAEDQLRQIRY
ncbi:MAG: hypothetical protein JNM25_19820 [Planctomycetes bacterium]|nr:hypothetical protein [Planctomycetota bacterium]